MTDKQLKAYRFAESIGHQIEKLVELMEQNSKNCKNMQELADELYQLGKKIEKEISGV